MKVQETPVNGLELACRARLEHKRFEHREVGPLTLTMQTFDVRSAPGQELVIYHAEPASPGSQALALLGSLTATALRES